MNPDVSSSAPHETKSPDWVALPLPLPFLYMTLDPAGAVRGTTFLFSCISSGLALTNSELSGGVNFGSYSHGLDRQISSQGFAPYSENAVIPWALSVLPFLGLVQIPCSSVPAPPVLANDEQQQFWTEPIPKLAEVFRRGKGQAGVDGPRINKNSKIKESIVALTAINCNLIPPAHSASVICPGRNSPASPILVKLSYAFQL
jgi:hypothetical protein